MSGKTYALITSARNEAAYIDKTLQAVVSQSLLPARWIIVNDGSVDTTEKIVEKYAAKHDFIKLVRTGGRRQRSFSSKVEAFNSGYKNLKDMEFEYLGILDADVSFGPHYYEYILEKFRRNERLGIAGGVRYDLDKGIFTKVISSSDSVGGGYQIFRRRCFDSTGGFIPLAMGGEDTVIQICAQINGWEVKSFREIKVFHHRSTGTGAASILSAKFNNGVRDYLIGYHPVFELLRCVFRIIEKPIILGSLLWLGGYCRAWLHSYERSVPDGFVEYLRKEQIGKLKTRFLLRLK